MRSDIQIYFCHELITNGKQDGCNSYKTLCKEHGMPFEEMQRWYDGYFFEAIGHVYSPNSVIEALDSREFENY